MKYAKIIVATLKINYWNICRNIWFFFCVWRSHLFFLRIRLDLLKPSLVGCPLSLVSLYPNFSHFCHTNGRAAADSPGGVGGLQRPPRHQRRRPPRLLPPHPRSVSTTLPAPSSLTSPRTRNQLLWCGRRTVKIGNKTCSLQPLVGRPFGSLFRVGADGLVPCAAADAPSRGKDSDSKSLLPTTPQFTN